MLEGFCCRCVADVPISADRRCLADGSLVLAPSTGCAHMRLLDGAWTACTQLPRCKPVAAGTWRKILAQQPQAVAKREADRAARRFSAKSTTPPKRATTRKPQHAPKATRPKREPQRLGPAPLPLVPCPACGTGFKPYMVRHGRRQQFCSVACANQIANPRLRTIPCPVCATPFTPISCGAGKRKQTCSVACGHIRSGQSHQHLERLLCPACGKPFAPKSTGVGRNRKQFCSGACWRAGRAPVLPRDERGRWARAS